MRLLRATVEDGALLASLNARMIAASGHDPGLSGAALVQRMDGWLRTGAYSAILLQREDQLAGYALFGMRDSLVHLRQFFILDQHRRQGLGRQAFELLFSTYWQDASQVYLDAHPANWQAIAFWRALGFDGPPEHMVRPSLRSA